MRLALMLVTLSLISPAQEAPTFRSGTTLVEFTIVAVDRDGKPVTDLKQSEIQLTERGRTRQVAFFRFEGDVAAGAAPALPPNIYSNRTEYTAGPPRNVTAILLDALNTTVADQMTVRDQVLEYLRTLAPGSRVAVYWLGAELHVVHDFTVGVAALRDSLAASFQKLPHYASGDIKELDCLAFPNMSQVPCVQARVVRSDETVSFRDQAERRKSRTLAALEALGDQLAGIPGRKSLVWIGSGIPAASTTGSFTPGDNHSGVKSYEAEIRKTAQRLATQGVVIYPVDAKGKTRGNLAPVVARSITNSLLSNYLPESANSLLADLTGGRVVRLIDRLATGIELAESDRRASYSLGFYAVDEQDNNWHALGVKTTRRDVKITHRQGYLSQAPAAQPVDWTEAEWRSAIANPIGSTSLHLDARFESVGENRRYGLLLQIQAADLHFRKNGDRTVASVQIALADKTPNGQFTFRVDPVQLDLAGDRARFNHSWQLAPGASTVRLIVRDRATGHYGTLDLLVK